MGLFCKHDWEVLSDKVTESEIEMISRLGRTPKTYNSSLRKSITVVKCNNCGKIKKFVEVL